MDSDLLSEFFVFFFFLSFISNAEPNTKLETLTICFTLKINQVTGTHTSFNFENAYVCMYVVEFSLVFFILAADGDWRCFQSRRLT